ncbi:cyclase family protein [Paenibacillus silvisoli]|uniref:cyclase family protein n=1 Tax=Paenibacillus silvisoli TaxID=3110539 RepID=UPI002804F7F2|nr:cyclase family protein [Paenibacillus silvisoli]
MRFLDITGPIRQGMWSYGAPLPPVEIERVADLRREGWSGHKLLLNTLSGTYLETADHLFEGREQIADVPPERLISRAVVAQLPDKGPLETITAAELSEAVRGRLRPGDALLVSTGWDRNWDEERFVTECPYFEPEAMEWVVRQDVSLLGLDVPCVQDPRDDDGSLNRLFFQRDRLLLAPLTGLRAAGEAPARLIALPLLIPGVCGTPCRAILERLSDPQEP